MTFRQVSLYWDTTVFRRQKTAGDGDEDSKSRLAIEHKVLSTSSLASTRRL